MEALTGYGRGGLECGGDLGVHLDKHVLLLGDLGVALLDALLDPGREVVAHDGIGNINQELLRDLLHLLFGWQVREHLGDLDHLGIEQRDGERLVLGHMKVTDLIGLEDYRTMKDKDEDVRGTYSGGPRRLGP